MRVGGSLRLVLNSKIWSEMLLERLTPKRLKISGTDPAATDAVALFLITVAPLLLTLRLAWDGGFGSALSRRADCSRVSSRRP